MPPAFDAFGIAHVAPKDPVDTMSVYHIAGCDRCRRDFPEFAAAVDEFDNATKEEQ